MDLSLGVPGGPQGSPNLLETRQDLLYSQWQQNHQGHIAKGPDPRQHEDPISDKLGFLQGDQQASVAAKSELIPGKSSAEPPSSCCSRAGMCLRVPPIPCSCVRAGHGVCELTTPPCVAALSRLREMAPLGAFQTPGYRPQRGPRGIPAPAGLLSLQESSPQGHLPFVTWPERPGAGGGAAAPRGGTTGRAGSWLSPLPWSVCGHSSSGAEPAAPRPFPYQRELPSQTPAEEACREDRTELSISSPNPLRG